MADRRRALKRVAIACFATALIAGPAADAQAHDFTPGVLSMVERERGELDVAWTEPVDSAGAPGGVVVVYPAPCAATKSHVSCGGADLRGTIRFEGMHAARTQVMVRVEWRDGSVTERVVTGSEPSTLVAPGPGRSWTAWTRLGIEHILGGVDHLAFLLGLALLVGLERRLLVTATAFTIAHSLSLALATIGVVVAPSAPVEATIAASVVLVAYEALVERPTLARRWPWIVALVFGVVHGLGFASALAGAGIPRGGVGFALLFFNVGIELGQLGLLALAFALTRIPRIGRLAGDPRAKTLACYAMGSAGAYWMIARVAAIITGPS